MIDMEKLHYEEQLEGLTLEHQYALLQAYADWIEPQAYTYDLEDFIGDMDPIKAVRFMFDNDLTPDNEYYWTSPYGNVECGDLYDYTDSWYSDDIFWELVELKGLDYINNEVLQDGYIAKFGEE